MNKVRVAIAVFVALLGVVVVILFSTPKTRPQPTSSSVPQLLKQAKAALAAERIALASRLYDQVLQTDPGNGEALLMRGQLARDAGDKVLARRLWASVPDHFDKSPRDLRRRQGGTARFLEATLRFEENNALDGERLLRRAVELNPQYLQPRDRLVQLYVAQMRTEDVRRQLQGILRLRPWTLDELVLHELIAEGVTNYAQGAEQMSGFIAGNPDDLASHFALARYYMLDARYEAAEQLLRTLHQRRSRNADLAGLYAETLIHRLALDEAEQVLTSAELGIEDAGEHYWRNLGRLRMEQGDWQAAAKAFHALISLVPNDLAARNQYASALQRLGRRKEAAAHHQRAEWIDGMRRQADRISHGSKNSELLLPILREVARFMVQMERYEEAVWWYAHAMQLAANPQLQREFQTAQDLLAKHGPGMTTPSLMAASQGRTNPTAMAIGPEPAPDGPSEPEETVSDSISQARLRLATPLGPPRDSQILLRDVHREAGLDFAYFNGQTGLKYLVESMGGGVAILDYDSDGFPDIYLTQGCALPTDDANTEHRDRLYRNNGQGGFEDVTLPAGLGDHRYGQGCAAADFDNDGDPDLYVANFGRDVFYENNGDGTFTDITEALGGIREKWSSGAAFADFDRDGLLDLYVVHYVDSLKVCHASDGRVATCDPHNFGGEQDRLYRNRGDGTFEDITKRCGIVAKDGKGLGLVVADFDWDGWPDIYVANDGTPNFLWHNQGGAGELRFSAEGRNSGVAVSGRGEAEAGMGVACADFNYDGLLDLYVTNFHLETNTMYLNLGDLLFHDATRSMGLADPTLPFLGFGTQAVDLDLDGRWELFVANGHIDDLRHRGDPWKMEAQLFRESGGGRFIDISSRAGPYFQKQRLGRGVARLDFDRDNDPDLLVVNQLDPLALLRNESKSIGNALILELRGTTSSRDAVGARIEVQTPEGLRTYAATAGDGFFSENERRMLIGLGDVERCPPVRIIWPNGQEGTHQDLPLNQVVYLIEPDASTPP